MDNQDDRENSHTHDATLIHTVRCHQVIGKILANKPESDVTHELHVFYVHVDPPKGRRHSDFLVETLRDFWNVLMQAQLWLDQEMGQPAVLTLTSFDVIV